MSSKTPPLQNKTTSQFGSVVQQSPNNPIRLSPIANGQPPSVCCLATSKYTERLCRLLLRRFLLWLFRAQTKPLRTPSALAGLRFSFLSGFVLYWSALLLPPVPRVDLAFDPQTVSSAVEATKISSAAFLLTFRPQTRHRSRVRFFFFSDPGQ